ncbi:MAG: zinc-ribbon domain-containing protein, partial [Polyangiales bacterium]
MALTIVRKRGKRARKKWPTPRAPDRYLTHAERLAVRTSKHWVAGFPQLVAEWHPKKNIDLYPYEVRAGSARQVWWKCPKGPDHEWLARVHNRVPKRQRPRGSGCPFCAGKRVSVTTCLAATRPKIAAEWHPTKNAKLTPHEVLPGDTRAVWWKCRKGPDHEYRQTIVTRAEGHQGCPYCRNFLLSVTNSLETKFPTLAAEWHPTKNRSLTAADVRAVDKRAFWWLCDKAPGGRAWRATIGWRRLGAKCPHCTSFAAKHPKLLAEWHVSKNAGVDPWSLKPSARRAVWWKCASGARDHVWKTTIAQRTQEKTRCPFCARKAVSSSTSLKALFPQIARQWHPTKNGSRTPDAIAPTTPQKAWWSCGKPGHVWEQSVGARTRKKKVECPFCAGRRAARETSLARTHPAIAALWDKTKNGEITPRDVTAQSDRLIHWKCDKGPDHEWTDRIGQRIRA